MSFPRYPAYKSSGVEWLGSVPEHWRVDRLKRNLSLLTEKSNSKNNPVALENIEGWSGRFIASETEFEGDGVQFETEDILFGKLRPYLAKVLLAPWPGEAVGDFHVLRTKPGVFPRFAQYLMLTRSFIDIVDGSTFGSKMPRAGWEFVGDMPLPIPSFDEQKSIAGFLNRETAKIDALVAEQEQLITLLKEKRQAVISHAVTKGLDPSVPMKDSGVEWLGDVPAHWDVRSIKHVVATPITDGPHETPAFLDEGIPFVSAEAVSSGVIDFERIRGFISEDDHARYSLKYKPKRGDIFMVKSGATTGVTAMVETDMDFNIWSPLAVIRTAPFMSPHYVLQFMRSLNFQEAVTLNWSFGTQQNIGMGVIENLAIAVPPLAEQQAIAGRLMKLLDQFQPLISEATEAIRLLQERRAALISAAVTGQIDVRQLAQ